ncbi:MAG: UDP-glucose 4-epimerase GalE [Rhodobacteraceae bacterium]|nr:UDP-glucose 4-epimerase GalE [Paracoccaceae bacterium]
MSKTVLATGGAGYIGSHVVLALLNAGYRVVVFDNLSNSSPKAIERVARISNGAPVLVEGDVRDAGALDTLFENHKIDAVIHLAGLKAVGESVARPGLYYDVNVAGSSQLLNAMLRHGVSRMVFSSSATVYGETGGRPMDENTPTGPVNPYGKTKLMVEQILTDMTAASSGWRSVVLRYFNPVAAHGSGEIGEDPLGVPDNLFPFIAQVATGRRAQLDIFGNDYDTPDGTAIRDYIHVEDLARGHVMAIEHLFSGQAADNRTSVVNLGTGQGSSVREVHRAWEAACGFDIATRNAPRRAGDVAIICAEPGKAADLLGWRAKYDLARMCADHWRWQKRNPEGYR